MNLETINKWLDNEYGVSYTRLEELHDFVVEQDLKHQEKAEKEINRLNNVINELEKWLKEQYEFIDTISEFPTIKEIQQEHLIMLNDYENVLDKLKELKENRDEG